MEINQERTMAWLRSRGISDEVIKISQVHYNPAHDDIVIPIFNREGTFVFNKYRRAPWNEEGPKYRYEAGATAELYNAQCIGTKDTVIICEGELDVLLLLSKGYNAVSSTGGSGTFLAEWAPLFDYRRVFICYDTDDAGIKGALKVQTLIPHAKIVCLPAGKDVTEFFARADYPQGSFGDLLNHAKSYRLPKAIDWDGKRMPIKNGIKENEHIADLLLQLFDDAKRGGKPARLLEMLLQIYNERNESDRRRLKYLSDKSIKGESNIAEAKKVPITNFLDFPYTKTICCIWHNESTPSMHYYEQQNVVKCFGCDRRCDVIDIVMQLKGIGLPEAVKLILNK